MRDVRCVWPIAAELGEGPCWSVSDSALWFADIKGRQVHRFDPATGGKRSWPAPDQVSFVLPEAGGSFVTGLPGRVARFIPATGAFETLAALEGEPSGNRLNDACIDTAGRLWFGSMDDRCVAPTGVLYCWDGGAAPIICDDGFTISNGPADSPDGRTLYHTDSALRTIYRYELAADGAISGRQPFIEVEEGAGLPDGSIVDAEGCLWVALYGGAAVRRYSPLGELLETVAIPCANVTKLVLGGAELKTAFVTTAWQDLSAVERGEQPLAGGLFAFETDVPGLSRSPMDLARG
jgi:xylono-1,5-lactonase